MRKKNSDIKVNVFIRERETNKILAGQREATLNRSSEEDSWKVHADSIFIESEEAYESITTSFNKEKSVGVQLEFLSGNKYIGSCIINSFKSDIPYADLEQYTLSLKSHDPLPLCELNKVFS